MRARVAQPQLLTLPLRKWLPSLMVSFPHLQRHNHFGLGEAPKRSTTVKRPNFWPVMLIAGIAMISPPTKDGHAGPALVPRMQFDAQPRQNPGLPMVPPTVLRP